MNGKSFILIFCGFIVFVFLIFLLVYYAVYSGAIGDVSTLVWAAVIFIFVVVGIAIISKVYFMISERNSLS